MIQIGILEVLRSVGSAKIKTLKLIDLIVGGVVARIVPAKTKRQAIDLQQVKTILVIRPGGIGDAVFLIPFLKLIRMSLPFIQLDVLCEFRNQEIFKTQSNLCNMIYLYDQPSSFISIIHNNYDVIIDTEQWHYLSALTSYFLKHKLSIGFSSRPFRAKLFTHSASYLENSHELSNFQNLFRRLIPSINEITDINNTFTLNNETTMRFEKTIPKDSVSIFLGSSIPIRRLSEQQACDLISYLINKNYYVILLGGRDVTDVGSRIAKTLNHPKILNFTGQPSLEQSAAIIKRSRLFIGPDSGLMHLACAVGTSVVAIFGPGNINKWKPVGNSHIVVTKNEPCSPCTHVGYTTPTCKGRYQCMTTIDLQSIKAAASSLLQHN